MGKSLLILAVGLGVVFSQPASSQTWYVDGSVTASGDGMTWETAFETIQEGTDAASDGDTVIVAEGTYVENIRFNGKNITLTSTDPLDSAVVANTIIDGNQSGSVVTFSGAEDETCTLSGFTITNGKGATGGGIAGGPEWSSRTHANICDNLITGNSAASGGGLAYCSGAIKNNVIWKNTAQAQGGGLYYCRGGLIENNTIVGNSADQGGGLSLCNEDIRNCIIWGNTANTYPQLDYSNEPLYSCVERWGGKGQGSMGFDPRFVDPQNGDFHLQSRSPCIDAGDPASPFSNEPEPNGGRVDMGAYGNTPEATSKSPDTDYDSLPDDWEMEFFGSLSCGADDDPDADAMSNIEEYRRGFSPSLAAGLWHVDASVAVSGDGTSWERAFKKIQEGIDAALDGDTVTVAPGTYLENVHFHGKDIVLRSTDPLDWDVVAKTIVDGNQAGSVVAFGANEDAYCVLSGFTIRNGRVRQGNGGGIQGAETHATIENNVITGNSADWNGGGLHDCDGLIRNNIISNNSAGDGGGLEGCSGTIRNNVITRNSARGNGGGVGFSVGMIENNTVYGNSASRCGGISGDAERLANCIIWGNTAPYNSLQLDAVSNVAYCCIQDWRGVSNGNIPFNPYFVDAEKGDFHLQSRSPCIDAGDPASPFSNEPEPNGGRVDMGAYGNTPEATSKSPDTDNDALPDDWEIEFFGDLRQGSSDDMDGDLISNIVEYQRAYNPSAPPTGWYVDTAAPPSGDGRSWDSAFRKIQEGIGAASPGDTVIVAQGTYFENVSFNGKIVILRSTDPLDSNVVARTIIDGRSSGPVVAFVGSEDGPSALCGFTIQNGGANYGGGVCGGERLYETPAAIRNNVITGNGAYRGGGGIAFCDGPIEGNQIIGNSATGGLFNGNCVWEIPDGGGLYECHGPIRRNTISQNSATHGGGIYSTACGGTISDNLITGNHVMSVWYQRGPFPGDEEWVPGVGGGVHFCGPMVNNTICNNSSEGSYGGVVPSDRIVNCVIWENTAPNIPQLSEGALASYSCIQDWAGGGIGNITQDPGFVNAAGGDYRLQPTSPCIGAGVNYFWFLWPERDLDRNCRLVGERVDMGCYEHASSRDTDGDLLSDDDEVTTGSDPHLEDTDGDTLRDGVEVLRGSDPAQPTAPGSLQVPSEFSTIQLALFVAMAGDQIVVSPGTHTENLRFYGTDVVLRSTDPANSDTVAPTILEGDALRPVVQLTGRESSACVLSGLTIRNGWGGISGGTSNDHTQATIRGNVITENLGMPALYNCDGPVEDNIVKGNPGGGLYECNGLIQRNLIAGNSSGNIGGIFECDGTIRNNLVIGNSAWAGGGLARCGGTVQNCTIVANSAQKHASGLYECDGAIMNCIIWGNTAPEAPQIFESPNITYSCIQDWVGGGEGDIADDPLFVDADGPDDDALTYADNDYRLNAPSPCIDAGKNEEWMPDAVDLDGNPRIWRGRDTWTADMGAYECGSFHFKVTTMALEGTALVIGWSSAPGDAYRVWSCSDLATGLWTEEGIVKSWGWLTRWQDPRPTAMFRFYKVEIK